MKTILCLTLTLLTFVTLAFVPNAFAQDDSPEYVVRQIYFHPNDLEPIEDIDATLDKWVKHVQQFYTDEMERHGFGRKTFQLETDAQGNPVRHYVKGKFTNEHYRSNPIGKANEEISEQFDRSGHFIYLNFIKFNYNQDFSQVGGNAGGDPFKGTANITLVDFNDNAPRHLYTRAWTTIAHELGHAFGLPHDFRDDRYMMSYGPNSGIDQLSSGAAEWLDAHRYFNTTHNSIDQRPTIRMLEPSFVSSPNTIRLRFEITHSAGLHQARLLTNSLSRPGNPHFDEITVSDCKSLNGNNTTIEFVTDKLAPATEYVALHVIDEHGNFTISQRFPIDLTALLPESKVVSIPDANLAAAIRETLGLAPDTPITELDMLGLGRLVPHNNISRSYTYSSSGRPPEKQIKDLTGIEYATNLEYLNLPYNAIGDITPITELTKLRSIDLSNNQIQDIGPVKRLTKLTYLKFSRNQIRDITPLASLTSLVGLHLENNQISDITTLKNLNKLDWVTLDNNEISDVRPLAALVNPIVLNLRGNPIKDRQPLLSLLRKNPDVEIYLKWDSEPLPVNLSYFRAEHTDAGVILKWITESEIDNAGFYIYRSETKEGEFKAVNTTMIQGAGTTGERNEYIWTDTTVKPNTFYYYRIEDVSHAGVREQLATVRLRGLISARGKLTTIWADLKAGH